MKSFSEFLYESNKSGDSSLRDWFTKSRASDGTPGWVQLGGKYAGKPCAKQPGQTTKPKCGSSKMKAALSDDEEQAAFERKNRQDRNPDREGKAKNVATEEVDASKYGKTPEQLLQSIIDKNKKYGGGKVHKTKLKNAEDVSEEKDACYKKVKSRYKIWPSAYASGALVKCRKVGAANWGNKTKKESYDYSNWRDDFRATEYEFIDLIKPSPIKSSTLRENYTKIQSRGTTYSILLNWRGKFLGVQMFFPQFTRPTKEQVTYEISKLYPGARVTSYNPSIKDPSQPLLFTGELNGPK